MAKKKKKPSVHKINPIIIREVTEEDDIKPNYYIPYIEENISKSEPETEPMDEQIEPIMEPIEPIIEPIDIEPEPVVETSYICDFDIIESIDDSISENVPESFVIEVVTEDFGTIPVEIPSTNDLKESLDMIEKNIESLAKISKPKKPKKVKTEQVVEDLTDLQVVEDLPVQIEPDLPIEMLEIFKEIKEIEVLPEDFQRVINPNIDLSIAHRFMELSCQPFELRYKTVKIYDSRVSKCDIEFKNDHVVVDGKKYPYSNLRIINK
jgi:hypothetical protein